MVYAFDVGLDWRVLALAALTAVLVSVSVGLAPARQAAATTVGAALKVAGTGRASRGSTRALSALVVAQMAVSTMLLAGCTLLARAYVGDLETDPGMDMTNGLAATLDLRQTTLTPQQSLLFFERVRARRGRGRRRRRKLEPRGAALDDGRGDRAGRAE